MQIANPAKIIHEDSETNLPESVFLVNLNVNGWSGVVELKHVSTETNQERGSEEAKKFAKYVSDDEEMVLRIDIIDEKFAINQVYNNFLVSVDIQTAENYQLAIDTYKLQLHQLFQVVDRENVKAAMQENEE